MSVPYRSSVDTASLLREKRGTTSTSYLVCAALLFVTAVPAMGALGGSFEAALIQPVTRTTRRPRVGQRTQAAATSFVSRLLRVDLPADLIFDVREAARALEVQRWAELPAQELDLRLGHYERHTFRHAASAGVARRAEQSGIDAGYENRRLASQILRVVAKQEPPVGAPKPVDWSAARRGLRYMLADVTPSLVEHFGAWLEHSSRAFPRGERALAKPGFEEEIVQIYGAFDALSATTGPHAGQALRSYLSIVDFGNRRARAWGFDDASLERARRTWTEIGPHVDQPDLRLKTAMRGNRVIIDAALAQRLEDLRAIARDPRLSQRLRPVVHKALSDFEQAADDLAALSNKPVWSKRDAQLYNHIFAYADMLARNERAKILFRAPDHPGQFPLASGSIGYRSIQELLEHPEAILIETPTGSKKVVSVSPPYVFAVHDLSHFHRFWRGWVDKPAWFDSLLDTVLGFSKTDSTRQPLLRRLFAMAWEGFRQGGRTLEDFQRQRLALPDVPDLLDPRAVARAQELAADYD